MKNEKYTYLLLTYGNEGVCHARFFKSEFDDLNLNPYGDKVGFAVGSNQSIRKEEDATPFEIQLAVYDAKERQDFALLQQTIRKESA